MTTPNAVGANVKQKAGTVSPRSQLSDPGVQAALKYLETVEGHKADVLKANIEKTIAETLELQKKSPLLYDTIAQDAVANAVHKAFDLKAVPKGCDTFNPVTFSALVRRVKAENPSIFPLRNFVDKKPLAAPRIILVPTTDKADEKWNSVETAAATPTGEFIFNTSCLQKDMNWAFVTGIKPKSKKYASNGGDFPDEWCIVEFTILHEFFHYTHADFHYQKILKGDPTIINWVGDFRSNYDLIKAGHEPYKSGLYNDHINYDRQKTYKEMYDLIKAEFDKLNKPMQDMVKKLMDGLGDDHSKFDGPKQSVPASQGEPSLDDLEEAGKKASAKAGDKKDGADGKEDGTGKPAPKADKGGPGDRSTSNPQAVDWKGIKPRFNWKSLLDRLIRAADTTEVTYQKVHRRNITGMHIAAQVGAGVIRPGEKEVPANLVKLCLVIDSSGSMHQAILKTFAELNKLFSDNAGAVAKQFAVVEFSSDFHIYNCVMSGGGKGSATEIKGVEGMKSAGGGARIDLSSLMSRHAGGGTNFDEDLVKVLKQFIAQKYNVVVMTDSDITQGTNLANFMHLYGHNHNQVFAIFDSRETFVSVATTMKQAGANISHF
jgi:Putative metallopeptidase domain